MSRPIRVLALADDCNPDWPSLPVVGYKAVRAIAEYADVTVATHVRNKAEINRDGIGKAKVVFLDNEYIASPMYKLATFLRGGDKVAWTTNIAMAYPSYLAFEREVYKRFKAELKRDGNGFDIVHRITPMSPTLPSPIASWGQTPFVLGPLNGGLKWPSAFNAERKREREWMSYLREAHRILPFAHSTYRKSAAILSAFGHTTASLPADCHERVIDFPEVGVDSSLFSAPTPEDRQREDGKTTFLFAGRLVPYKCADVVVSAFAASEKLRKHRLVIVGDGPERPLIEAQISEARLQDCVQLLGSRTQAEVGKLMRTSHVFAFPSIRELGAGVVVEAMACGMASVVVDYGGPGGLINDQNGVKVPLASKGELVQHYVRELEALADNPERCRALGERAHVDAMQCYSWDAKAKKTIEVYEWVLGRRPTPPNFYEGN